MDGGASAFIVGTCQLHSRSLSDVFDSNQFPFLAPPQVPEHRFICGSSVEFYIEPIHSCIDDVDVLIYKANELCFTDDVPILPDDIRGFLDTIRCFRIKANPDHPGFVQMRYFGNLRYDWTCKKFDFQRTIRPLIIGTDTKYESSSNVENIRDSHGSAGPAFKFSSSVGIACFDLVPCLWCPQWPDQAQDWPFRQRHFDWPNAADIRKIVQSGCHVVQAKHPACRNDIHQWRLSFSAAELCLIQSWSPVQQIVYHMLRFIAKRELMMKDCPKEDEVLCTYHIKTLMLWSCEEMSPKWWTSSSMLALCCHLLRKLSDWLKKRHCPNYFIPQANLHHNGMNMKVVTETIGHINELCNPNSLDAWFTVRYILPILEICPHCPVLTDRDTLKIAIDFGQCMLSTCKLISAGKPITFDRHFSNVFWLLAMHTFREVIEKGGYNFRGYVNMMCCLTDSFAQRGRSSFLSTIEFSSSFLQFGKVLFSLHAAHALTSKKITHDSEVFIDFIRDISWQRRVVILKSKHHNFPKPSGVNLDRSAVLLLRAQDLMENLTGLNSPQEFKLLSHLSKELLRDALCCDDLHCRDFRSSALVYMASLHFSESDFETVIRLSSAVLTNNVGNEEENFEVKKETLNAGCLLYIDDVVRIIGIYLIFKTIRNDLPYNRIQIELDLRITPEIFTHYLIVSSRERTLEAVQLSFSFLKPRFLLDELLTTVTHRMSSELSKKTDRLVRVYQRNKEFDQSSNGNSFPNHFSIVQLLTDYSLENMTSFYNTICKDFGIRYNTVDCYRAAYLYRCRKYHEALHLCERILDEEDVEDDLKKFAFANVVLLPPLDSYFDSDIKCLLGFHTLVFYLSPLKEANHKSTFQRYFAQSICFNKSLLSAVLLHDYPLKCYYSLGRHFLARYFKLMCLMRCSDSRSEAVSDILIALKSDLPFEHILRCFIQEKCRKLQIILPQSTTDINIESITNTSRDA